MSLNSFLKSFTQQRVNDVDILTAERAIRAGDTVAAPAVHTSVRRAGTDAYGDAIYKQYRCEWTAVGLVTSVDFEGVATVRYFNEISQRWQSGQWHVNTLGFIYNETAIA